MKRRDCIRTLEGAGFRLLRTTKHSIYKHSDGRVFILPNKKEVDERLVKQMYKTMTSASLIYERNQR